MLEGEFGFAIGASTDAHDTSLKFDSVISGAGGREGGQLEN